MRFTLDELRPWNACNMADAERVFKYGQSYSLRESSKLISFNDLMWFLVNRASRDPYVRRKMCQWVNQLGGVIPLDAEMHVLQHEIHKVTRNAVRALNDQGVATNKGHEQVRQTQLAALLPIFDD